MRTLLAAALLGSLALASDLRRAEQQSSNAGIEPNHRIASRW